MKQVLLVVASNGFQQVEYRNTKKELEAAGIKVVTASDKAGKATGHDGNTIDVDMTVDAIHPREFDGIFLIGGDGAMDHLNTPTVHKILSEFFALRKPYGAICISPRILAEAKTLRGKHATCWDGDKKTQELFAAYEIILLKKSVVDDEGTITANGPDAASEFGQAIARRLLES